MSVQDRTRGSNVDGTTKSDGVVRLSINLAADVAAVLRRWAEAKHISVTEAIRRAIAIWNFIETEKANGNTIAIIENSGRPNQRIREVVLID